MSYLNPRPPALHGDDVVYTVEAGGKPKTSTPADRRLKENKQAPKPTASRSTMPKAMPKMPKRK